MVVVGTLVVTKPSFFTTKIGAIVIGGREMILGNIC